MRCMSRLFSRQREGVYKMMNYTEKKEYQKPALLLVRFTAEDVLAASSKVLPTPGESETPIVVF